MGRFSVNVVYENGEPAGDIGVMIDYGWLGVIDEKRTHSDGWIEFYNHEDKSGTIWVNGHNMGSHSLSNNSTYSYTIETSSSNILRSAKASSLS
jgi:hypothetical protein